MPWLFVFSGGTDPAGARETGARGMWSLGFGPAPAGSHGAWAANLMENRELALRPRRELAALWEWLAGGRPVSPGSAGLRHFLGCDEFSTPSWGHTLPTR